MTAVTLRQCEHAGNLCARPWPMPPGAEPQRLAAIVSIDIVGYSSLSERDAAEAVARVARLRDRATAVAAEHQGRIFNTAGDGVMLEFPTATAALSAAMTLSADVEDMQGHVVTVHVRQGHYADDGADGPAPDWTFDRIGDLLMFDPASFLSA